MVLLEKDLAAQAIKEGLKIGENSIAARVLFRHGTLSKTAIAVCIKGHFKQEAIIVL